MKKALLLFAALLVAGCGEKEKPVSDAEASRIIKGAVHIDDVAKLTRTAADISSLSKDDDGKIFWDRTGRAYSGWFKGRYESGEVESLIQVKDGWVNGLKTTWHKNGQKLLEGTWKNDELDGPATGWHENGQKKYEITYKDDKEDGLWTQWYENGQKEWEGIYKDGKADGLYMRWYENGQKKQESTYKDGELISEKYWNSKGEEFESEEEAFK